MCGIDLMSIVSPFETESVHLVIHSNSYGWMICLMSLLLMLMMYTVSQKRYLTFLAVTSPILIIKNNISQNYYLEIRQLTASLSSYITFSTTWQNMETQNYPVTFSLLKCCLCCFAIVQPVAAWCLQTPRDLCTLWAIKKSQLIFVCSF